MRGNVLGTGDDQEDLAEFHAKTMAHLATPSFNTDLPILAI